MNDNKEKKQTDGWITALTRRQRLKEGREGPRKRREEEKEMTGREEMG